MLVNTLYLEKETGTLSDALAAFGLAALAEYLATPQMGSGQPPRWEIFDEGSYYRILIQPAIDLTHLPNTPPALAQGVDSGNVKEKELQGIPRIYPLATEWERLRAQAEQRRSQPQTATGADLATSEPSNFFSLADFIAWHLLQFRPSYHDLLRRWHALGPAFPLTVKVILDVCSQPPGQLATAGSDWAKTLKQPGIEPQKIEATRLQALNPTQGKGLNRPKPTAVAVGNKSGFWVMEYLKAAGLEIAAVPRRVRSASGQQIDARKLYVVAAGRIRSDVLAKVMERFRSALRDDQPVKMDVQAALLLARAMLQTQQEAQLASEPWVFEQLGTLVSGLHTVTFQGLGQHAAAVMNIGFLDTPSWLIVDARTDLGRLIRITDEHLEVIRGIDEQGDGFELLRDYRGFVTTSLWDPFLNFCAGYGEYLLRSLAQGHCYLRTFTVQNLEVLMQRDTNLTAIVQNPGFRAIATAIRLSTIIPQYLQQRDSGESLYDVRYGLAQDLIRHSLENGKFAGKLSEFVQSYNAENARVYERRKEQRRPNIQVSDLDEVVRLVDEYGAPLIARLLVAYGYARDPRDSEVAQPNTGSSNELPTA